MKEYFPDLCFNLYFHYISILNFILDIYEGIAGIFIRNKCIKRYIFSKL